jgi:4-hydroxy-2-oxoheptanedioate aldolase
MTLSPLHHDTLSQRLTGTEPTWGTFLGLAAPMAGEVAAVAGADWVILDLEHGGSTLTQVGPTVVAVGAYGVPTIVRVPTAERIIIGQVLDAGAAGVMVPRLTSANEVATVVSHMSHPPHGDRGVASYNRAGMWALSEDPFPAPRTASLVIQIETAGSLDECEAIAATPGVDALFVGPLDLSFALGTPRDFTSAVFQDALARIVAAAHQASTPVGILANDHQGAAAFASQGFSFVAIGSDSTLLARSLRDHFTSARATVSTKKEDNDVR